MVDEDQFSGWAEYYDLIYEGRNEEDKQFYLDEMDKTEGKILEIGCGTGRIYIPALEKGIDIYGFDISEEMIEKLREKAENKGLEPKVKQADMTDFSYNQKFSLIIIPFRTYLHNLTVQEQLDTLKNCKEHLEEDGKLILNFYLPDYEKVAEGDGSKSIEEIEKDGETFRREVEVSWQSEIEEVRKIHNRMYNSKEELVWESEFKTKIVSKPKFELLLRNAEFSDWQVYGGFNKDKLESTSQEAVWIVEK